MSAKHTPGPWEWSAEDEQVVSCDNGAPICDISLHDEFRAEQEANARLIAAAPEMVEELRKAAAQFRFYEAQHRAKGTPAAAEKADVNQRIAARIEALIAKATGA